MSIRRKKSDMYNRNSYGTTDLHFIRSTTSAAAAGSEQKQKASVTLSVRSHYHHDRRRPPPSQSAVWRRRLRRHCVLSTRHRETARLDHPRGQLGRPVGAIGSSVIRAGAPDASDWPRDTPGQTVDLIRRTHLRLSPRHISHQFSGQNPLSGWPLSVPLVLLCGARPAAAETAPLQPPPPSGRTPDPTAYIPDSYRRPDGARSPRVFCVI